MLEANESEHEPPEPKSEEVEEPAKKPKHKILNMPTTPKILQQVECQACGRKMSAKTLKYGHAKYCPERVQEEQPEDIPVPKIKIKNGEQIKEKESLPVKRPSLKRTKTTGRGPVEEEAKAPTSTPDLPPQTPEMDTSFKYQMRLRTQQKEAKYQVMMSNAF